ncbi:MAG: sulfatase [Acidobacteriota bacterium]
MDKKTHFGRRGLLRMGGALGSSLALSNTSAQTPERPNILLVLSDDHSVPHVGCYGNKDIKTPNLDRFAAQGMRFDRFYVMSPQCAPSRSSIMTGRSPVATQMTRFSAPLPMDVGTYPEVLRANGYFTGVAGRTYHLNGEAGKSDPLIQGIYNKLELRRFPERLDYVRTGNMRTGIEQFSEFLDLKPKDKPFFMQLGSNDPHRPFGPNMAREPHDPAKLKLPSHFPDTPLVREDFGFYYDKISRFDDDFGTVMQLLEDRGLAANTLVAFLGDNGAALLQGKGTLHEFGINVPLIMRWPGRIKPGRTSSELLSAEDLAPTALEAAGVAVPKVMTGRSFLNHLRGEAFTGRKHVFAERGAHHIYLPMHTAAFDLSRCVVGRQYKFIYNALWQLPYEPVDFASTAFWKDLRERNAAGKLSPELSRMYFAPSRPMFELYDLVNDPGEFNNLAGRKEAAAFEQELRAALVEWMVTERDFLPLPIATDPPDLR